MRPRVRLTLATIVLLGLIAFGIYGAVTKSVPFGAGPQKSVTVRQALEDKALVGKRIAVGGNAAAVDKAASRNRPWWRVRISDESTTRTLPVLLRVPEDELMGSGRSLVVFGTLKKGPYLVADEAILRGPPKRRSSQAMTVDVLVKNASQLYGVPLMVKGIVATGTVSVTSGGDTDFTLAPARGKARVVVHVAGRDEQVTRAGTEVVVSGSLSNLGVFVATSVRPAGKGRS